MPPRRSDLNLPSIAPSCEDIDLGATAELFTAFISVAQNDLVSAQSPAAAGGDGDGAMGAALRGLISAVDVLRELPLELCLHIVTGE